MKRDIIKIDEEKCNGCGICVNACAEGALQLINGKAKLVSESYCDGLGACLPNCPMDAISIETRESDPFDEEAVQKYLDSKNENKPTAPSPCFSCPSKSAVTLKKEEPLSCSTAPVQIGSELGQWPCQLKLVPINAPYFNGANLLVAADCTAFAYGNIHKDFMQGKVTLIGCPKLDNSDYSEKLAEIIKNNDIKSISVLKMEVPCCNGMTNAVKNALIKSGKMIPWQITTITVNGEIKKY